MRTCYFSNTLILLFFYCKVISIAMLHFEIRKKKKNHHKLVFEDVIYKHANKDGNIVCFLKKIKYGKVVFSKMKLKKVEKSVFGNIGQFLPMLTFL